MNFKNAGIPAVLSLAALISISTGSLVAAAGEPSDYRLSDYRDFEFTPEKPYYYDQNAKRVDFGTYNGFRRYHADCHVCHGPAGMGSSYAPALMDSLQSLSYNEFVDVIVRGKQSAENLVMPSFAANMNVMPYIQDMYAYLKARSDGVIGMARPNKFPKVKK
jgi:methanol metabolism-related c-type cytochrome